MNNNISSTFAALYEEAVTKFFSRKKEHWSIFANEFLQEIGDIRQGRKENHLLDDKELLSNLTKSHKIPEDFNTESNEEITTILKFLALNSKNWENPASVENVITMPSDAALYGYMIGAMVNPNLVYNEYAGIATTLEKIVAKKIANMVGYDTEKSTGIFTAGGTFCNLYGYLAGIRKSIPYSKDYGLDGGHIEYRIINSMGGHYSNVTNLSLLGVDIKRKTIRIQVEKHHDIDIKKLENQMRSCFNVGCVIPTIMLTLGTTDTFGTDDIKLVYDLREKLCEEYNIEIKPHIHVDSAVGWALIFFLDYDFKNNPLQINQATLQGLEHNMLNFRNLKYADSFTVDFHKWGYVPYTSSLVMFKDKGDLKHLANSDENFSYFEADSDYSENYHYTIECSRGGAGVFGAYAGLEYMGVKGYQITLAHCLQNANYFRERLESFSNIKVIASDNQGPNVCFRIYDKNINGSDEFEYEFNIKNSENYTDRLKENSKYHRSIFLKRKGIGLYSNWVESISYTAFDKQEKHLRIPGEKAVFMNPRTTRDDIDAFINNLFA